MVALQAIDEVRAPVALAGADQFECGDELLRRIDGGIEDTMNLQRAESSEHAVFAVGRHDEDAASVSRTGGTRRDEIEEIAIPRGFSAAKEKIDGGGFDQTRRAFDGGGDANRRGGKNVKGAL